MSMIFWYALMLCCAITATLSLFSLVISIHKDKAYAQGYRDALTDNYHYHLPNKDFT